MIATAEYAHRVPGITAFKQSGRAFLERAPLETLVNSQITIENLQVKDLPEFTSVMHKAIDSRTDLHPDDHIAQSEAKTQAKAKRSEDFYRDVLKDPKKTVLVARDKTTGRIIGGLEGEESYADEDRVDGQRVAYVLWVGVNPNTKIKGVASSLYSAYEAKAVELGATFLLANVDNKNLPSRKLHDRNGFSHPYLEKIGADAKWHSKQIGLLEKKTELPVTESDYMPVRLAGIVSMVSKEMDKQGLGRVVITVPTHTETGQLILDGAGNALYNIVINNELLRRDFEVIMEKAAELATCSPAEIGPVRSIIQQAVSERVLRRQIIKH